MIDTIKKKILLISSGQPSLNPRLVKEADSLCDSGYEVTVLYAYWNTWGTLFDKQLIAAKKWRAILVAGDPDDNRFTYFLSKVIFRIAQKINNAFTGKILMDVAIARPAFFLKREAKRHIVDIYIAHNLGALPAAVTAAKTHGKPCGFDAEDFHRNEVSDDVNNTDVILKANIEDRYLPQLNYFTTSSPQIADAYFKLYPDLKPAVLLNVFPTYAIKQKVDTKGSLKLFWFSQTIGANRGIESIAAALSLLNKPDFELHLLGNLSPNDQDFINKIKNSGITVTLYEPIPPNDIIAFAGQFDIGLALENQVPYNRDICLTNKIFTYMQAGLAIVASDTLAQRTFIADNPTIGKVYPNGDEHALADILSSFQQDRTHLTKCKNEALHLAQTQYNWETESLKFLTVVKQTLDN